MSHWPERLGPGDTQVLRASRVVPDGAKLVWMEQWFLDTKGVGCWLSHEQLGARLGQTARSIENYRLRLEGAGLLVRLKERGVRAFGWRVTLPTQCRIRSQRPSPAEVARVRVFLDRELGRWPPETLKPRPRNPQTASLEPSPVRVSSPASTAFDSGLDSRDQASTAFEVKGSRDVSSTAEAKAGEAAADLEERTRNRKRDSDSARAERDPALVRAEGLALIRLRQGKALSPEDRQLVQGWIDRQPKPDRYADQVRKAVGE